MVVYKYFAGVPSQHPNIVEMPAWAQVIKVAIQDGNICLWATVDSKETTVQPRKVWIVGTGWELDDDMARNSYYAGTVFNGRFVWHVFVGYPD